MDRKILLTSFTTWLPDQKSNSSDDLLVQIAKIYPSSPYSLTFLRQLPVDIHLASSRVIDKINAIQPDVIICCGMAQKRTKLTIESTATCREGILKTPVCLEKLVAGLAETEISHDAGKFVCEGLYYSVLEYLQVNKVTLEPDDSTCAQCIFVHVPILSPNNLAGILADFCLILQKMTLYPIPSPLLLPV